MLTVRVYTESSALREFIPQWQHLVKTVSGATVYQTPEWALAWLCALRVNSSPFGIALFKDEWLVGFVPLCIDNLIGVRIVRFMGGDLNDVNSLLVEPAYATQLQDMLARTLEKHRSEWDVVCLTGLDEREWVGEPVFEGQLADTGRLRLRSSDIPTLTLATTWEDYQASLSAHRRKRLRQTRRHLSDRGEVSFKLITEPWELSEALPVFYAARMENWRARKRLHRMVAIQHTPGYWSTLTGICLELASQGRVWLGRLELDGLPIAWDLAFVMNSNLVAYMTTFDAAYARYSPGQLVAVEMIRCAIKRGMQCVIKGRGAQPYKYWFGAVPRNTENILIFANRPRAQAYVGMKVLQERAVDLARRLLRRANKNA